MKFEEQEGGGFILVDKPYEMTSFQVVKKVRRLFNLKKIGHAGTLDPLATGLLVLCYGKFTKRVEEVQAKTKTYTATIKLGEFRPSFDKETEVEKECDYSHVDEELIQKTAEGFLGEQEQMPPKYSAVKIGGVRAYKMARQGKEPKLRKRIIEVYSFDVLKVDLPMVHVKIVSSKGTYIRTLAKEFGERMNTCSTLEQLRRESIGEFTVEDGLNMQNIEDMALIDLSKPKQSQ